MILTINHTPIPPLDHLINFIGYMSASKLAPSTIKTYISAIAFQQKINNFPDTTKSFIIQKLLIGLSRKNPSLDIRRPITLPLLHAIIQALPHTCHSTYESILFTSAYLLAYFGFLRVGDLTVTMGTSLVEFCKPTQFQLHLKPYDYSCSFQKQIKLAREPP